MTYEELYQEYVRTVMRTVDGLPVIGFPQWLFNIGIPYLY